MLEWQRHYQTLTPEKQEAVQRETAAARAAGGSRLAVALHLLVIRRILVGDATNPKQKKLWSDYLAANLLGFSISRAQVFKDMKAAAAANAFPAVFLGEFINNGYALNVRPTADEPLGKFTKPCQHILQQFKSEELSDKQCQTILAEAAAIIKTEAKKNRPSKTALTAEQKRMRVFADLHNDTINYFAHLADAIEPGDCYESKEVRDDLEEFVCRLMTAMDVEALELRHMSLPGGFDRLSLPGLAGENSEESAGESSEEADVGTSPEESDEDLSEETSDSEETGDETAMAASAA